MSITLPMMRVTLTRNKDKYRVDCVYQEEDMAGYGVEANDFVPICVVN
jgi:hypothetical protein